MEYPDEKRNISSICELLGNLEMVRKELGKRIASDEAVSWYRSFELCGEKTQGTVASMLIITISNLH